MNFKLICAFLFLGTTAAADENTFSLYRTSLSPNIPRIHVATFDTKNGKAYNFENCWLAAKLFEEQPDVDTRFWCEPGKPE